MEYSIEKTDIFDTWLKSLKDRLAKVSIARRIARAEGGNLGDHKSVGEGVSEMRIFVGKGYRIYFTIRQQRIVFLLCGGDKSTQPKDIDTAIKLSKEI